MPTSGCPAQQGPNLSAMSKTWEERVAAAYAEAERNPDGLLDAIARLTAPLDADDPLRPFEIASAHDYLGREAEAIPLYRRALELGLSGEQRLRCQIQLASSLRNVGRADEGANVLAPLLSATTGSAQDWVRSFLALCLASAGEPTKATGVALEGLSAHLTSYQEPVRRYARRLYEDG